MPAEPMIPDPLEMLSLERTHDLSGLSIRTLHKLRTSGRLKSYRVGERVLIRRVDFEAFLAECAEPGRQGGCK